MTKKTIAMLIIHLVICIPIYSSIVFADRPFSSGKVYGETYKVNKYYREDEGAYINITVQLGDLVISPLWLHFNSYDGQSFDECHQNNGAYDCSYYIPAYSNLLRNQDGTLVEDKEWFIRLYEDNDFRKEKDNARLMSYFDSYPPIINSLTATPSVAKEGDITLSYDIQDRANKEDSTICSGIKELRFESSDTGEFKSETLNTIAPYCSRSGDVIVPIEDIVTIQDNVLRNDIIITLTAYDRLDQPSILTIPFTYDTKGPTLEAGSFAVKDTNQNEINFVGENAVNAEISFTITSDDLEPDSVFGDLSAININPNVDYSRVYADCSPSGSNFECTFTGIQIKLSQTTTAQIEINATDKLGNDVKFQLSKTLTFDNTGPSFVSITTNKTDEGTSYVGGPTKTQFIAQFTEAGVGLDETDIYLDLTNINGQIERADSCQASGSTWTCYWDGITPTADDGPQEVSVVASSSDKLQNLVSGLSTATVVIDTEDPRVISSEADGIPTSQNVPALADYIKTTDQLEITAIVEESSVLSGFADFSSVVTTQGNVTGVCTSSEDDWSCRFASNAIDIPYSLETDIPIYLFDSVGNSVRYEQKDVFIHNYSSATSPSYWSHSVTCSPSVVDRQITNLINYRVMCSVLLDPIGAVEQETISMALGACTDNFEGATGYIGSQPSLINAQLGSFNPYIGITLTKTEMRIDEISVNCPLSILTRAGDTITQYPEIENITIDIGLYNMPYGEFYEDVEEKILAVQDEIGVGWEWISSFKEMLFYAEKICSVLGILADLQKLFGLLGMGTSWIPGVGRIINRISAAVEKTNAAEETLFQKLCNWISCDTTLYGNWYTGMQDAMTTGFEKGWEKDAVATSSTAFYRTGLGERPGGMFIGSQAWLQKLDLGSMYPKSPKESLFFSLATGCIPGIINGIERWRQVQCNYGVCLWDSAENNIPLHICEDQKAYMECKFVAGEIVQILPLYWLRQLGQQIAYIFSDPLSLVFGFAGFLCPVVPGDIPATNYCRWVRGISYATKIAGDIQSLVDSETWQIQGDMCEEYFDRIEELEGEDD